MDDKEDLVLKLKQVDMLDVVRWINEAWNEVPPITIVRSWRKLLDHRASDLWRDPDTSEVESCDDGVQEEIDAEDAEMVSLLQKIPGCEDAERNDIAEWMGNDDNIDYTEDDILQLVTKTNEDNSDEAENSSMDVTSSITHAEGFQIFERALQYVEQQSEATATDIIFLRRWKEIAAKKRFEKATQLKIDQFFKN